MKTLFEWLIIGGAAWVLHEERKTPGAVREIGRGSAALPPANWCARCILFVAQLPGAVIKRKKIAP